MDEKLVQQLMDEMAIRSLADKFSDAANRKDGAMFQSLWADDGEWVIGEPINRQFSGKAGMSESVVHMLGLWDFFVQLTGPGVVLVEGDRAFARFYVNEIARGHDGKGNYNLSMYEDELVKEDSQWLFLKRTYHTIYQDAPDYRGLVLGVPEIPTALRMKAMNR
ncbi:MAG: nuclear transport factor 2 family protein [Bacteroidetes bacterium]|nr:nuclear transport factor 2 family protein [Fibrella sp.]